MDLLTQLNCAMDYIEKHITDIELTNVSKVTTYSPYHFSRLFYYIAEMSLSEYIRKRKLSLAGIELKSNNIKIIDIALKYGYDSADSFTRAFVKQHGITPSIARKNDVSLKIYPKLIFQIKIKGVQEMNWRIETKESFEVFGIEGIFKINESISDFWEECSVNGSRKELFKQAESHNHSSVYGVINYYDSGENTFPYMICILKEDELKTERYKIVQIPKLTWAVFRVEGLKDHGDDCQINNLFSQAYSEWLPSSGYDKANGPEVEVYGDGFEEVWIPVYKK